MHILGHGMLNPSARFSPGDNLQAPSPLQGHRVESWGKDMLNMVTGWLFSG